MGAHSSPTAAYWSFFENFNAKDPDGWAAAMSYPHTRVSAAPPSRTPRTTSGVYPKQADYARWAEELGWERFEATGWVRTQGVTPRVVHASERKVHLAGGWTRYRADDSKILTNRVLYVMTRTDDGWGIQARFGVDSFGEGGNAAAGREAVAAAERLGALLNQGDHDAVAGLIDYPFTIVGVGEVLRIGSAAEQFANSSGRSLGAVAGSARVVQAGSSGVSVAWTLLENGVEREEILLMVGRGGEWRLAAASAI